MTGPRAGRRGRRLALEVLIAVAAGIAIGLALDVVRSGGVETWLAARGLGPPYEPRGRLYDVDGTRLYLDCRGSGPLTVVLENGLGSGADGWGFVLPELAERARVCAYDRAGIGRSGQPAGRHSVGEAAADLRALLAAGGERPPWLLVGHSLGGVYARVFVDRERADVTGLVLVDAYFPDAGWLDGIDLDPAMLADWEADGRATAAAIERVEALDWPRSLAELEATSLDGLATEVLAIDQRLRYGDPRLPAATEAAIIAAWERWILDLAPGTTRLTIAERSGHVIQLDRPDLVIAAVDRLLTGR